IPQVAASERGTAQTSYFGKGCCRDSRILSITRSRLRFQVMFKKEVTNLIASRTSLERQTKAGDSPVGESIQTSLLFPKYPWSRLSVANPGLLRSKAKYF